MSNKNTPGGACPPTNCSGLSCLNVWQINTVRWEDDERTKGKDFSTIIVCKDIAAVWEWIETDRNDLRTEVRGIGMIGPACAIIPNGKDLT